MNRLRVAIADDEPIARQRLARMLAANCDVQLAGSFASGDALVNGIRDRHIELVLLDIDMPELSGFATVHSLSDPKPLVAFVTAHGVFATQAYDLDAVDYLMKPVSADRLAETLRRARRRLDTGHPTKDIPTTRYVNFAVRGRVYHVEENSIVTINAAGHYVEVHTQSQQLSLRLSLDAVERLLDPHHFVRVHRSWIVRRDAVKQVSSLPGSRHEMLLDGGIRIPGGRAYAQAIIRQLRRSQG